STHLHASPTAPTLFPYTTLFRSFESLAGRPPFSSPSAAAVLDMHQHHAAPDLHGLRRDVPRELAAVVARALAKSRAERWQRAMRSEEHTSELQLRFDLVCRRLLE